MRPFISACLIVKNEENVIARCLDSIKGIVDEIIIVDTGSTDKTVEIVHDFVDEVFTYEWTDSFANARNFASSKATGEWILVLDADEYVDRDNLNETINSLKSNSLDSADAYIVKIYNFAGKYGEQVGRHESMRIYRNNGDVFFVRAIHEQLTRKDRTLGVASCGLILYHSGYLNHTVKEKKKNDRNVPLVKSELDKAGAKGFDYFNLGNELYSMNEIESALDAYKKAFMMKGDFRLGWVGITVVQLINCLVHLKKYKEALGVIEDCEQIWENTADFQFIKATIYANQKRYDDAREVLENLLARQDHYTHVIMSIDSSYVLPNKLLGALNEACYRPAEAVQCFLNVLRYNRIDPEAVTGVLSLLARAYHWNDISTLIEKNNWKTNDRMLLHVARILFSFRTHQMHEELIDAFNDDTIKEGFTIKHLILQDRFEDAINKILSEKLDRINLMLQRGCFTFNDLLIIGLQQPNQRFMKLIIALVGENDGKFILFLLSGTGSIDEFEEKYVLLLQDLIRLQYFDIFEKLIETQKRFISNNVLLKIGNFLYEFKHKSLAIDFYLEVGTENLDSTASVHIIESFLEKGLDKDALDYALTYLNNGSDDYRICKYAIEILKKDKILEDANELIKAALRIYPDSNWLKNNLTPTIN